MSRKVFFTRNGEILGKPFDLQENFTMFASASVSSVQDCITFNFTGPFEYVLDEITREENETMSSEINLERIDPGEIYKLIRDYLEYQGYPETLKSLEENMEVPRYDKNQSKSRSFSTRISERYESIDIDPSCQTCQNYGKICKNCLKNIMENVEASSNIRLPESRGRCDSIDLSSLYLKHCEKIEVQEPPSPLYIKDVKARGQLRKIILQGKIKEVITYLTENFPEMLSDEFCMLYLAVQEFIEIVKTGDCYSALEFAREKLAKYKNFPVFYRNDVDLSINVWEVIGLLAYENPYQSPLSPLLSQSSLEMTADLINSRILQKSNKSKNSLETVLKQTILMQQHYQESVLMTQTSKISFNL